VIIGAGAGTTLSVPIGSLGPSDAQLVTKSIEASTIAVLRPAKYFVYWSMEAGVKRAKFRFILGLDGHK
jgi:hypothetical protein